MKKNNNGKNHSFYNEANKSILGQQQMTPKKFFAGAGKLLKWGLWMFLIIITLWGCVMNFIIQKSHNLGQGVEFYQTDDFVYPNMYQANDELVGYTATANKVNPEKLGTNIKTKSEPFDFKVLNPYYGVKIDNLNDPNITKKINNQVAIINASNSVTAKIDDKNEVIEGSVKDAPEIYSYNLNQLTWAVTGINDLQIINSTFVPASELPIAARDEATGIKTMKDVVFKGAGGDPKKNDPVKMINLIKAVEALVTTGTSITIDNFTFSDEITKEIKDANNVSSIIDEINVKESDITSMLFGFKPSTSVTSVENLKTLANWEVLPYVVNDHSKPNVDLIGATNFARNYEFMTGLANESEGKKNTEKFFKTDNGTKILGAYGLVNVSDLKKYDISSAITSTLGTTIYGGSEVFATQIKSGFPVKASQATIEWVNQNRPKNYRTLGGTQKNGYDPSTQNYGWMLMDSDKNVDDTYDMMRSYTNFTEALNAKDSLGADVEGKADKLRTDFTAANKVGDKGSVFYGDTRRNEWGIASDNGVFDNNIKKMMNNSSTTNGNFMSLNENIEIGGKTYDYKVGSKFAGMTSITQLKKIDDSYIGVLPQTDPNNGNYERSILSDSVNDTGQDSWAKTRVSFVGWSDWGKAFNIQYGPLYGFVIFPLAQIAMGVGEIFNYGVSPWGTLFSIAVVVFLLRGLGALLSLRGTKNQMKMQEVQTEVAKIKAKYSKYDLKAEPRMKQKQQQEIMALYRKNDVNPMGSLGTIFVTMPIFISLWIIISALPAYKIVVMGNFSWAISSFSGIFSGGLLLFIYLAIGVSVGLVQGISSKLPTWLSNKRKGIKRVDDATKKASKKQNKTQNIMIGVFVFMGLTTPALFAFYWIMSGMFTIFLELLRHGHRTHKSNLQEKNKIGFFEKNKNLIKQKLKKQ